jgi:type IV pilus assembly protein PilW
MNARRNLGFTIVEMMIAMAISLVVLLVVTYVFANMSESNREIDNAEQQIENGRYALQILTDDLREAGYYGYLAMPPAATGTLPDPCDTSSTSVLYNALAYPVQGVRAPDLLTVPSMAGTTCAASLLTSANLKPGSDILVIRRVSTAVTTGSPTEAAAYLQANVMLAAAYFGDSDANIPATNAAGGANTIFKRDGTTAADTRQLIEHIYFVAPCRQGSGAGGVCQPGDDTIPTLKRLELGVSGGVASMVITPLVDGIDYFKVEYGIDNSPTTPNPDTGLAGDGIPDNYTTSPLGLDWTNVVAAKIYLVARNVDQTPSFTDDKTYQVGTGLFTTPANDAYKRHQFETEIRLTNVAGRREIPQ